MVVVVEMEEDWAYFMQMNKVELPSLHEIAYAYLITNDDTAAQMWTCHFTMKNPEKSSPQF